MSAEIVAQRIVTFRDVIEDRHLVTVSVGPVLEPLILSMRQELEYRRFEGGASFAKSMADRLNEFRVHYCVEGCWYFIDLDPTRQNYHLIQPLGTDEWLLVRARASSNDDENAHVYGFDGRIRRSFPAGDGISDVQVTQDSQVWVGFFYEGVYGGFDFGHSGLVCLDAHGKKVFDFMVTSAEAGPISDCYALNVCSNHDTWLHYYTDFPLVKLTNRRLGEWWKELPISGSPAFAVGRARNVLFAGGYHDRGALLEIQLPEMTARRVEPMDESGNRIENFVSFGRSHGLFLRTEEALYRVDCS